MANRKAFTLIELLIIIAIIGILASVILVTLNTARNRAKDSAFKTTAKSIQTGLVSCCLNSGTFLGNTVGGSICASGSNYPDENSIGTIEIMAPVNCVGNAFLKVITPGKKNSGNCTKAWITSENINFIGC